MRSGARPKRNRSDGRARRRGAVLLEVVLALVLFVGAAAVISSALSASVEAETRLRHQAEASDLAVSVLSELEMAVLPVADRAEEPFSSPYADWTREIGVSAAGFEEEGAGGFRMVEITVRHPDSGMVYRLRGTVKDTATEEEEEEELGASPSLGGTTP